MEQQNAYRENEKSVKKNKRKIECKTEQPIIDFNNSNECEIGK